MRDKRIGWDGETLHHYLESPKTFIPGNKMIFPGLKKETEREGIFLISLHGTLIFIGLKRQLMYQFSYMYICDRGVKFQFVLQVFSVLLKKVYEVNLGVSKSVIDHDEIQVAKTPSIIHVRTWILKGKVHSI